MNKERILLQIEAFFNQIRTDYLNNIINAYQFKLLRGELSNLIKNINNTDVIITASKLDMLKTIYIIMK